MGYKEMYEEWLNNPYFDDATKAELKAIEGNEKEIEDRFYMDLEFGTAGLRGVIGAGTNRMNVYTVRKATQGLANYINNVHAQEKGVAIAYDSRHMSPEFADVAALCLAANGIKAYVFESLRPTPELSYAVRRLGCTAGINITASHNPPEYNGYKVYWEDGAQITSKGIKGRTGDETYYAGTAELLTDNGVILPEPLKQKAESWLKEAKTVVWFGHSTQALAIIAITDEIKPTSLQAIRQMEKMGLTVYMLTGDNVGTAQAIARKANIGHYRSGVLPHDKAIFIEQLQQKGARVAMVGDGINDSAALAQADLSIAMGKGSDIAMETAMVTILSSDLLKIPETIRLSRLTVKTIRQNLFWAFIYNLVSIPIAAGILYPVCGFLLNPMIGGAAMAFSSVSVVSNSLRLKRKKISLIPRGNEVRIEEVEPINKKVMKKRFTIDGMMCGHCRAHVEKALNSIDGVKAIVTLDPPEATIEFTDKEFSLNELQQVIQNKAGDYKLHDLE